MKIGLLVRSVVIVIVLLVFSVHAFNRVTEILRDGTKAENRKLEDVNNRLRRERDVRKFTLSALINEEDSGVILGLTNEAFRGRYTENQIADILGIARKEELSDAVSGKQK